MLDTPPVSRQSVNRMAAFVLLLLAIPAGAFVVANLGALLLYPAQLFPYRGSSYGPDDGIRFLRTARDERIAIRYSPASGDALALLLYSHGNGEDIGHLAARMERLNALGFDVLAYDYPGYGLSTGKPDGPSVLRAAEAALGEAHRLAATRELPVMLWGYSVGSGPSCHLARDPRVVGTVLESPFESVFRVFLRIPWIVPDPFPNRRWIREAAAPVLVLHGSEDRVIPADHAVALAARAPEGSQLVLIEGAGHNDLFYADQTTLVENLLAFTRARVAK